MNWRILFLACLILPVTFTGAGCSQLRASSPAGSGNSDNGSNKPIDPQQVQNATMNFAIRYITAMADVYDQALPRSTTLEARSLVQQSKLNTSLGALGDAVNPNPVVGLMDMTLMVALTKEIMEEPWAGEQFSADNAAKIHTVLTTYDSIVWEMAASYLTPDQIAQLRGLVKQWREQHPGQRFVGGARLADFTEDKQTPTAGAQLANSVFSLVRLDPFTGLDPAVRQVEESRILAERMFFYMQYMPMLLSWQADVLYDGMLTQTLAQPQVKKLLDDTSTVAGSTTRFTDATASFSDYCGQFARTVEKFRADIPEQLASLVKQLDAVVAAQREAALKQASAELDQVVATQRDAALTQANDQLAAQRDAAIKQLNAAVQTQQELIAKNLQDVLNASIDRLYQRTYSVVLISAGSLLAVLVIYRLIAARLAARQAHP